MTRLAWLIALVIVVASTAHAQLPEIEAWVVAIQSPPLKITNIQAGWAAPQWASEKHKADAADYRVLPLYLQVQNVSQKPIAAYRFTIATYDPFGDYVDTIRATAITGLAPQASEYGRWRLTVRSPLVTGTAVIYLDAVRYQDRTNWRIDPESVASLIPRTAPVRFHSWHIIPDPREFIGQVLRDMG